MNKLRLLLYAKSTLQMIGLKDIKIEELPEKMRLSEEDVIYVLKFLKKEELIEYTETAATGFEGIAYFDITPEGMKVALGKRELIENNAIVQNMNINAPVTNIAQSQGDNTTITQTVNNSKYFILKEMIRSDSKLKEPEKNSLLNILEKFNTITEAGDNALDLLKKVGSIASKYVPFFFSLLH